MTTVIEMESYRVSTATNGKEALQIIYNQKKNCFPVDILVTDVVMPELDGVDTFFEIRELRPEMKIILCSGYDEKTATEHLVGRGLAGFIQKPYTFANLKRMIRSVLDS
jgi:two-component system cell cycle sensor histidine kinase/response regulator CckA